MAKMPEETPERRHVSATQSSTGKFPQNNSTSGSWLTCRGKKRNAEELNEGQNDSMSDSNQAVEPVQEPEPPLLALPPPVEPGECFACQRQRVVERLGYDPDWPMDFEDEWWPQWWCGGVTPPITDPKKGGPKPCTCPPAA
jgi:hypothetical protein